MMMLGFFSLLKQGAYYTQPVYAAQPHVIHHTTVVQPNSIPSAIYPAPVAAPRTNGVAMGMVAGTTMAMSAGKREKSFHVLSRSFISRVGHIQTTCAGDLSRTKNSLCIPRAACSLAGCIWQVAAEAPCTQLTAASSASFACWLPLLCRQKSINLLPILI